MRKTQSLRSLAAAGVIAITVGTASGGMIGYFPFDVDTNDASGNGKNGVASGDAALASGQGFAGAGAYQFSGGGHVVVPIDINPSVLPNLTVTMWVRADAAIASSPGLYKTFGHDDGGWDRTIGLDSRSGPFRWSAFTGGAGPEPTADTGTPVSTNWVFLAGVWETDANGPGQHTIRFHADGNYVTETLFNTPSGHTSLAIGNLRPDNFNEGWRGLIDEVRIYDEALSVAQVAAIRQGGFSVPETGPSLLLAALALGGLVTLRRFWR